MSRYRSGLAVRLAPALSLCAVIAFAGDGPAIQAIQNRAGAPVAVAGDVVDLIGSNLAAGSATAAGWPLPWSLASTQVFCNNYPAPMLSAAPDRVRIQLPWELAGLPTAQIRVVRGSLASDPLNVPLAEFGPAILGLDAQAITPGQIVTFRVIGLGPRNGNPVTGNGPTADAAGSALVRFVVLIGGAPAPVIRNVLATGDVQDDAGVQAVSVQVPFNLTAGDSVPVQIQIGGAQSPPFPVTIQAAAIQISLSPAAVQVPVGGSVKFSASVQGSDDTALKWSLDANSYLLMGYYGSIKDNVFTAGYNMAVPNWVIVRATHSSGAFASALVQLVAKDKNAYRILPDSPVIAAGESISLTLIGPDGAPVDGAFWYISDWNGSLKHNVYTAPLTFAALQVGVGAQLPGILYDVATTTIVIDPPRAQITGTSPRVGHIGEPLTFEGSGVPDRVAHAWFTMADGSRIRVGGQYQPIIVPHGAVSGPVWIELSGGNGGATFLSPPFQLTILPRLRLHASRQRVASGESIQIVATAPDIPGPWPLTWRADLGSMDSKGMFQAPAVTEPAFARIWACLLQNSECGTTVVEVLPFRLEPDPLILNPGETTRLKAWQGSAEIPVAWQAVTPNVSVTPDGKLTAGAGPFDGGLAVVSAKSGGISQALNLSVRTAGAVAHTAELYDWLGYDSSSMNGRLALGVFAGAVAVHGNWIYAFSRSLVTIRGRG